MNIDSSAQLRLLPSINELLQSSTGQQLIATYTRRPVLRALRASLDEARSAIRAGQPCPAALEAVRQVAGGYSNLEYELEAGERGSRHVHVAALLRELTGAEAALVTNNNAAAVLLALCTLAAGREVIISRGQLVEIGGGFRVPDVMRQSGC